jgi:hypothetical protein
MSQRRNGGVFALPLINQYTQLAPFGKCKEQTIEMWIKEMLLHMEQQLKWYLQMASELEQGVHLTGPCKNQWLKMLKEEEHMWEDVCDVTPRRDPNRVDLALQYLEDMIQAYLTMFCGTSPTSREGIQVAIDTTVMPTGSMSKVYSLYKRMLSLHEDLDEAHRPSYALVERALLRAIRRSHPDLDVGMRMSIQVQTSISALETRRLASNVGVLLPTRSEQFQVLKSACSKATKGHKANLEVRDKLLETEDTPSTPIPTPPTTPSRTRSSSPSARRVTMTP